MRGSSADYSKCYARKKSRQSARRRELHESTEPMRFRLRKGTASSALMRPIEDSKGTQDKFDLRALALSFGTKLWHQDSQILSPEVPRQRQYAQISLAERRGPQLVSRFATRTFGVLYPPWPPLSRTSGSNS